MYKLLIVEDEPLARRGLKETINWKEIGIEIVGEAKNGLEGYNFAKSLQPDLIISDIKMPVKDSIEMIKDLRKENINTEIIILSGYSEFEYAQTAIVYNVTSYLLKPVSNEELIDNVYRALARINSTKEKDSLKQIVSSSKEDLKRKIIRTLIRLNKNEPLDDIKKEIQFQNKKVFDKGYFITAILDEYENENPDELILFENELSVLLTMKNLSYLSGIYHQKTTFIVEDCDINFLENIVFDALMAYKEKTDKTLSVGISQKFESLYDILKAYEESKSVANNGMMKFTNSVQLYNAKSIRYSPNLIRCLDIINKEYMNQLSVSIVSERLDVSESYLMHLIKNELSTTFNSILTNTRIREAKNLLKTGQYRINEVAYMVGYNDEKYFTMIFKKVVGCTPSKFIKS